MLAVLRWLRVQWQVPPNFLLLEALMIDLYHPFNQLLGREYYQTDFGEKALVLVPITVHILSATFKRLLSSKPREEPRRWSSPLSITGYAVGFLFFPIHYLIHRVHPAEDVAPIFAVGPAELDYEFVKVGLQKWPIRSWVLYGGLTVLTTLHLTGGGTILWNRWMKGLLPNFPVLSRKSRNRLALGCLALPTLTGLYFLSKEPLMTFSSTIERYKAAFMISSVYRL